MPGALPLLSVLTPGWLLAGGCAPVADTGVDWAGGDTGGGVQEESLDDVSGSDALPEMCRAEITCGAEIPDEPKIPCDLQVESAEGNRLYEGLAGVELRGRSSLDFPKPQYAVELWTEAESLVAAGATWSWWDEGESPGEDWTSSDFDDSDWPQGEAPLGYGDEVTTTVSYGDDAQDKYVTTWYRHPFELDPHALSLDEIQGLSLAVRRDDGVAVYLNGQEVFRDNLPDGEITASTLAESAISGDDETAFVGTMLEPTLLEEGDNILAVEVHQVDGGSSDTVFDLSLEAIGPDDSANFYGMGRESDWILNGNYVDRSLFRNMLTYDLFRDFADADRYAAEMVFCEVTVDEDWMGIYTLGERIERDDDRVDIQADPDDAGGSFIVKSDDRDEPVVENTVGHGDWVLVYPRADDASASAEDGVASWIEEWQDAVIRWDPHDHETGIFHWIDMDSAVDFVLIQELARNNDAYTLSVHLWKDLDRPMFFAPWDIDLSFGYPVDDCGYEGWLRQQTFVAAMADDPDFHARLEERWWELRSTVLAEDAIIERIEAYREVLGDTVYENFERWPMEEITFEWGGQDWLCPVESYDEEYERIQEWIRGRLAWMDDNIASF